MPRLRTPPGYRRVRDSATRTAGNSARTISAVWSPPDVATTTSNGSSLSCVTRDRTARATVAPSRYPKTTAVRTGGRPFPATSPGERGSVHGPDASRDDDDLITKRLSLPSSRVDQVLYTERWSAVADHVVGHGSSGPGDPINFPGPFPAACTQSAVVARAP